MITLSTTPAFSQKQNNQWRFGNEGGISFNNIPPENTPNSVIQTGEGSAAVADRSTGALLFYTNGVTVWDADNQPMPNGTGLFGGTNTLLSSTTAAVIVPKPFEPGIYYIITIDEQASNKGIRYSAVDMSLNGGKGDIIAGQKNMPLFSTTSEKLQVVPTADHLGYWLITHDNPGNTFFSFKILQSGISGIPVTSTVGGVHGNGAGHLKVNRQFNKMATGNFFDGTIELYDFDNATGVINNPKIWDFNYNNTLIYGVEFSPDGSKLYVSNTQKIIQYDISTGNAVTILASAYDVSQGISPYSPATLQLAVDNKIYINSGGIDVVNCPDNAGSACGFEENAINNLTGGGGYGLPQWIYYLDDKPIITANTNTIAVNDTCLSNGSLFSLAAASDIQSVQWNFGDPTSGPANTVSGLTTNHNFTSAGNYTVTATLSTICGVVTLTRDINIINCNPGSITGIKIAGDTCTVGSAISIQAIGASSSPYFSWNFGDPASGVNDTITITGLSPNPFPVHTFSGPGKYNVCVTYQEPGEQSTTVCRIVSIGLCCDFSISTLDTCSEQAVSFMITSNSPVNTVRWNFNDPESGLNNTSTVLNPAHLFSGAGTYTVSAVVSAVCGSDTSTNTITIVNCADPNCKVYIPNVFSPNGDGTNDAFSPLSECALSAFGHSVYNRWGELVFQTKDPAERWDGKHRGKDCPVDVYVYVIQYQLPAQEKKRVYGDVTLLR